MNASYPVILPPSILNEIRHEDFDIKYRIYEESDDFLHVVSQEEQVSYILERDFRISLNYFKDRRSIISTTTAPTIGYAERFFAEYIGKNSDRLMVMTNRKMRHFYPKKTNDYVQSESSESNAEYFYYPDLLVLDESAGMLFDIEIDEPYSYKDGLPTHFLNFIKKERSELWCNDGYRDEFFSDSGIWTVRFAEEQVIKHPKECLELIDRIVTHHQANIIANDFLIPLNDWGSRGMLVARWTYDDAQNMAEQKYRNSYLTGQETVHKIKSRWGLDKKFTDEEIANIASQVATTLSQPK